MVVKYHSCLFSLALLVSITGRAQDFSWGIKAGTNLSNQRIETAGIVLGTRDAFGFHAGLMGRWTLSEKLSLQPELLYAFQQWNLDLIGTSASLRMSYLTLPAMLRFHASNVIRFEAGAQLGYLLHAEAVNFGTQGDVTDDYTPFDFGLAIGAGVDLPSRFTFNLRYVYGLVNIDTEDDVTTKNRNLQLSVGYFLSHNK